MRVWTSIADVLMQVRLLPFALREASLRISARKGRRMLYYALVFFIIALVAAVFGFGGIAAGAASIAQVLFFIFLVLFIASLIAGLIRRGGP